MTFFFGGLDQSWEMPVGGSGQLGTPQAQSSNPQVKELQHQVERLTLLNQAMWELVRERLQLRDADLERMANEVDMRDGMADGKMSRRAVRCPTCSRVNNSRHAKCLYCGQLFEKDAFA